MTFDEFIGHLKTALDPWPQSGTSMCGWISPSGNVCVKRSAHTGAHATRKP